MSIMKCNNNTTLVMYNKTIMNKNEIVSITNYLVKLINTSDRTNDFLFRHTICHLTK